MRLQGLGNSGTGNQGQGNTGTANQGEGNSGTANQVSGLYKFMEMALAQLWCATQ